MGCLKHISSFMGEFCQNKTKLCIWRLFLFFLFFFFLLGEDNVHDLSCLNYIGKVRHLGETNPLTVTCKSVTKGPAFINVYGITLLTRTFLQRLKKFSWVNCSSFLNGNNQLKIYTFLVSERQMLKQICTEDLSYSNQCLQYQGQPS